MFRVTLRKIAALSIAVAALTPTAGCADPYTFATYGFGFWNGAVNAIPSNIAMFGLGFWNGAVNTTTQTTCYVNGAAVDCSTVPESGE